MVAVLNFGCAGAAPAGEPDVLPSAGAGAVGGDVSASARAGAGAGAAGQAALLNGQGGASTAGVAGSPPDAAAGTGGATDALGGASAGGADLGGSSGAAPGGAGGSVAGAGAGGLSAAAGSAGSAGALNVDPLAPYPSPCVAGFTEYFVPEGSCLKIIGRFVAGSPDPAFCDLDYSSAPVITCSTWTAQNNDVTAMVRAEVGYTYQVTRFTGPCPALCMQH